MNCRSQFTFYKSFDDVIEDMTDQQIAKYMKTLLDVQFLRVKIEDVSFDDKMLNIVWKSQKHSIETSIKGYLDSQKREQCKDPFLGCYDTLLKGSVYPSEGVSQQEQEQEQVKEEGKGKEEGKEIIHAEVVDETETMFNTFWEYYPNKKGKAKAKIAFVKALKITDMNTIMSSLSLHINSKQWKKDGGEFIPHPTTWLNGERWNDKLTPSDIGMSSGMMDYLARKGIDNDSSKNQIY